MNKMLLFSALLLTASATVIKDLQASSYATPRTGTRKCRFFGEIRENLISNINKIQIEFYELLRRARTCEELTSLMLEYDGIVHVFPPMARTISSSDEVAIIDVLGRGRARLTLLFEDRCREKLPYELRQIEDSAIRDIENDEIINKRQIIKTFKDNINILRHYAFSHCTGPCDDFNKEFDRALIVANETVSGAYREKTYKKIY